MLDHRLLWGLLLLGLFAATSYGAVSLQADFSVQAFFGAGDAELDRLTSFKDHWGHDDSIFLVVATVDDGDLLTPARLGVLDELALLLERHPDVASVAALTQAPRLLGDAPGLLDLRPLIETLPDESMDHPAYKAWRQSLLQHPVHVPFLLSEDGAAASLAVELAVGGDDIQAIRAPIATLREQIRDFEGREGMHLVTAGIPAVRSDFFDVIFEDQLVMFPVILVALTILMLLLFRRAHALFACGAAALVPPAMVFGLMGMTGESLGILNQSYITLLPVIAVADAIHLVSRFHEEARRLAPPGMPLSEDVRSMAIRRAVGRIGVACFLTSTTTSIGFLSLYVARMPVLRNFGLYAAIGIVLAYGTVLLIIPIVLSFARGAVPESGRASAYTRTDRLLLGCAELAIHRPGRVLGLTALVLAFCIAMGFQVEVDNTLTGMLRPEHETTRANRVADRKLGGILGLEIDVKGPEGALKDPQVLGALLKLGDRSLERPEVRSVTGPQTFIAGLQQAVTGQRGIPESRAEIAQLLILAESSPMLAQMLDLSDFSRGRMVLRTRDNGGNAFLSLAEELRDDLATIMDGVPGETTARVTGTPWVAYRGINNVTIDLRDSLMIAFVAVTLIIVLLLRDVRMALICLVPNALPLVVGYGIMGAMGWILDPTPAVVFTVALGIAVDDTIHLVSRYREERAGGQGLHDALRMAVLHSGRAVVITSILLATGFAANCLSSFPSMVILGLLGAVVILVAMLSDLFVLPALIGLFAEPRSEAGSEP